MKIVNLDQIHKAIDLNQDLSDLLETQRNAFIDFSAGLYNVPLPVHLAFPEAQGDCHIKAGFRKESKNFVVKIANGSRFGNDGVILIFSKETGALHAILNDSGWLTTLRTAVAGLLAAHITPWTIENIGIIGSGNLAKTLYTLAKKHYDQAKITVYSRNAYKAQSITSDVSLSIQQLVMESDLIFTSTSSHHPLIDASDISGVKHIVALGSDDDHKQEIPPEVFAQSDLIIVDSKIQAVKFGDTCRALNLGMISLDQLTELGTVLKNGIVSKPSLMVTDLTGIAPQDIAIAEFIFSTLWV